jgi:O-antigen ligase
MFRDRRNETYYAIGTILILISIPISLKLNTLLIGALFLFFLAEGDLAQKWERLRRSRLFLMIVLYFAFLLGQLVYDPLPYEGIKIIETRAALLFIPIIFEGKGLVFEPSWKERISKVYVLFMTGLSLVCLGESIWAFLQLGNADVFFYHALSAPLNTGSIYLSLLVLMAMILLLYERLFSIRIRSAILMWLFFTLLLLASKTILLATVVLIVVIAFKRWTNKMAIIGTSSLLLLISLVLSTSNPIQKRFADIDSDRLRYVWQDDLQEDIYLDGMSMRLLFARFGLEIVDEEGVWLQGVGQGIRQDLLDQKIIDYHLYQGNSEGDRGYLGYNFHNQYMEEWVGGGLTGLLLFFACLAAMARLIQKDTAGRQMLFVFLVLFLTESVLLRQYGVVSFALFLCLQRKPEIEEAPPMNISVSGV